MAIFSASYVTGSAGLSYFTAQLISNSFPIYASSPISGNYQAGASFSASYPATLIGNTNPTFASNPFRATPPLSALGTLDTFTLTMTAVALDAFTVILNFSTSVSGNAALYFTGSYQFAPPLNVFGVTANDPVNPTSVTLTVSEMIQSQLYTCTIERIEHPTS